MGNGGWSNQAYSYISNARATAPTKTIFTASVTGKADPGMSPHGLKVRESCDSEEHPESLAIMVGLDVTGSMGYIPEQMARKKLGPLMNTIIAHGIPHPQIMFLAFGDITCDDDPLQVGQFESSTELIDKWLTGIHLEGGGGGQSFESPSLVHLVAARHTSIDCFKKRNTKGFLFTISDESNWSTIDKYALQKLMGYSEAVELTDDQLLIEASRQWNIYHIHVQHGGIYDNDQDVINYWRQKLGERLLILSNWEDVAELIATTIAVQHGADLKHIVSNFNPKTASAVTTALARLSSTTVAELSKNTGMITL